MKIVPKTEWRYPAAAEREYAKRLTAYIDWCAGVWKSHIPDMVSIVMDGLPKADERADGLTDRLKKLAAIVGGAIENGAKKLKDAIEAGYTRVKGFNFSQFSDAVKSVFGARPKDVEAEKLREVKELWKRENEALIDSVNSEMSRKIQTAISEKILDAQAKIEREPDKDEKKRITDELTEEIEKIAGVAKSRAALIGADQVGKLNSRLTQYRQTSMGVEEYIWRTQRDERVRPHHREREGKKFRWDSPPPDGHPGEPLRCRCSAAPVYDTDEMNMKPRSGSYKKL